MTPSILTLIGQAASSLRLKSFIEEVFFKAGIKKTDPEVKSYPNTFYFNYYLLGLSLEFVPAQGYKRESESVPLLYDHLFLDSIHIFNTVKNVVPKDKSYSRYPLLPLGLAVPLGNGSQSSLAFELSAESTGKDLVQVLGEPTRKGGGSGPSSGSIDIWCEWTNLGIMVEFGGDEARGPHAWDRGKDAVWKVVTLFKLQDNA